MTAQTIREIFDLTGKSAVVTGGSKGIGQAITFRLAEAGARVVVIDLDKEAAVQTVNEIKKSGYKSEYLVADVSNIAQVEKVIQTAVETLGGLDILINNAGIYPPMPVFQITEQVWDAVFDTNLKGMFFYSQAAAKEMVKRGHGGKIINLASIDGMQPGEGRLIYGASKAGVITMTKSLALELSPHKILVNAIAPGAIHTPGLVTILDIYAKAGGITAEALEAGDAKANTPMGYYGQADDIAKAALFLASEAASYMTGQTIVVDGGKLLK